MSPDGTEIAYVSYHASTYQCGQGLELANSSGERLHVIDDDWDFYYSPSWSPDGQTILYSVFSCSGDRALFTIPAAGGSPTELNDYGTEAAWGPTRIAFVGGHGLFTANPDGSDQTLVAKDGYLPAWSPTGELAYLQRGSLVVGSNPAVWLPFASVQSLHWTPDGTRLVVAARKRRYGGLDLFTLKPDGTAVVRLTKNFGVLG